MNHIADVSKLVPRPEQDYRELKQLRAEIAAVTEERDQLRARLAEIESAPTVAHVNHSFRSKIEPTGARLLASLPFGTELIARPAKDKP